MEERSLNTLIEVHIDNVGDVSC